MTVDPDTEPTPLDQLLSVPAEELRLALVLNGGVSLAVWMGGVAQEIGRLTRSRPTDPATSGAPDGGRAEPVGAYGPLLEVARTTAMVDIVSGTSAGGINGAALALAQVNGRADLRALRTLWAEQGSMEQLLRPPFQGEPTSMLRGDDYFLPELRRAMQLLASPFEAPASPAPIDLTLTTTLLTGAQAVTVDDFGERIPERIHAGTFHFSNIGADGGPKAGTDNLFGATQIADAAQALALAARCTASFPFAFEPAFVPVREPEHTVPSEVGPDMADYASWASLGGGPADGPQSRYAVDGGLLANTPVNDALRAIARRHADGPVRRAMLLVFPHAPQAETVPADTRDAPPSAAGSLTGVLGALMSQGSRSFVDQVDEHNRKAAEWQGSREQILTGLGSTNPLAGLYGLLSTAWPHYRHVRVRHAARGLADKVDQRSQWSYDRVRDAAEKAQRAWFAPSGGGEPGDLPYVPASFAWQEPTWQTLTLSTPESWAWGDSAAWGVAEAAAALLRSALSVASDPETVAALARARRKVGEATTSIQATRGEIDLPWTTDPYLSSLEPNQAYWRARIIGYARAMASRPVESDRAELEGLLSTDGTPEDSAARTSAIATLTARKGECGLAIHEAVLTAVRAVHGRRRQIKKVADHYSDDRDPSGVRRWFAFLLSDDDVPGEPDDEVARTLLRLLAIDAGTRLLADGTPVGANLPVRMAELSLRIAHPWARFSLTPDDKAAGLELARFGGFLKRSWRMNDWTWGRLDAVTMLCQTVLDPQRLGRMAAMTDPPALAADQLLADRTTRATVLFEHLRLKLYGDATLPEHLADLQAQARAELLRAMQPGCDDRHLPALARWAALPLQAEIILEELPVVAAAVEIDVKQGAATPTRGTRFAVEHKELLREIGAAGAAPPGAVTTASRFTLGCRALQAFDSAGVGREKVGEETGSNSLIRTAARAVGVLTTVADADARRGAPGLTPVTRAVRGAVMIPIWIVNGLAGTGSVAKFLASLGLVLGGLLLALSLLGVLGGLAAAAGMLGGATLLAALGYSALKTGSLLHAAALLAPVGPMLAFALDPAHQDGDSDGATRVLLLLTAVVGLYALANLPWPLRSPLANLTSAGKKVRTALGRSRVRRQVVRVGLAVALGLALLVADRLGWVDLGVLSELASDVVDLLTSPGPVAGVYAAVVVVGSVLAWHQGGMLRAWRPSTGQVATYSSDGAAQGSFHLFDVAHPAGVAAAWAPAYGAAFLLVSWLLLADGWTGAGGEAWQVFSFWWLAAIGVLLCLVAPLAVPRGPRRAVVDLLSRQWATAGTAGTAGTALVDTPQDDEQRLIFALLKNDASFYYLLGARGGSRVPRVLIRPLLRPRATSTLALSRRGRVLLERLGESGSE